LKVAVVGCGVAGSYMLNRIPPEHHVEAFEMRPHEKFWTVCAWGTSAPFISDLVKMAGFNFEDYILHRGERMMVDPGNGKTFGIKLNGLVTFDKHRMCEDMLEGHDVHWGQHVKELDEKLRGFDVVVDATGFHRSLMPKLEHDAAIPCFEVEVKGKFPWDDFFIRPYPGLSGYFWYFPLGDGRGHVGAGDFRAQYRGEIEGMVEKYGWEVVRRIGRPVRILPPAYCQPFYVESRCTACGRTIHASRILNGARQSVGSGQVVEQSSAGLASLVSVRGGSGTGGGGGPATGPRGHNGQDSCSCADPRPERPLVVGVGESIGTVYPLLGEGIIPSMQCVNLFVEHMDDMQAYTDAVLKHYDIYAKVYRFIKAKMDGNFSFIRQFPELAAVYWHMRTNEKRYGLETHLGDILNVVKV
jgi:flavin-dependent dehydrogenase